MHGGHSHIPYSHSSNCSQSVINGHGQDEFLMASQQSCILKLKFLLVRISLVSKSLYIYCLLLACQSWPVRLWSFGGSHIPRKQAGFKVSFQQVLSLWDLFGLLIKISLVLVYSADFAEVNSQIVENCRAESRFWLYSQLWPYTCIVCMNINNSEC